MRKYGKLPARLGAVSLKFGAFFNAGSLPTPPQHFGHYNIPIEWQEFGNDQYSDCVFAGAAHETMIWLNECGESVAFSEGSVLSDYSIVTGFDPSKPATDQGTDMSDAASYRQKTGVADASGRRHKVDSYVALQAGDVDQLMLATYLTGACGIGIRVPASADNQFDAQVPWDVVEGDSIVGGHYIPVIGRNKSGNILVVTWGRLHAMTPRFYEAYCDEALAYLSLEALGAKGLSPEGYNAVQLQQDIAAIAAQCKEAKMATVQGTQVDPDRVAAAQAAVKQAVSGFTYDGFDVGSRVTDAECNAVAVAVMSALATYDSAKPI